MVCASEIVQGSSSVVRPGYFLVRQNAGSWKKWSVFEKKLRKDFNDSGFCLNTLLLWSLSRDVSLLGPCHVFIFPETEILSIFCHCYVIILFCWACTKNSNHLFFPIHLFKKQLKNHMAAVMLQVIPRRYAKSSENSLFFFKHSWKILCSWNLLYCSPQGQTVLSTHLHISHDTNRRHWWLATEIGRLPFHMSTRGLLLYSIQVSNRRKMLPRAVKCLILCREQCILIKQRKEWTKSPALQKRDSCTWIPN